MLPENCEILSPSVEFSITGIKEAALRIHSQNLKLRVDIENEKNPITAYVSEMRIVPDFMCGFCLKRNPVLMKIINVKPDEHLMSGEWYIEIGDKKVGSNVK